MVIKRTPPLSVIMPAYNEEKYVADAIDSVLKQTFKDFELVIVNDGSIDGTLDVLKTFKDKRIKIFSQSNRGRAGARNYALKHSLGKFVILQDADDSSHPERFEKQLSAAEQMKNFPVVGCWVNIRNIKTEKNKIISLPESNITIRKKMDRPFGAFAFYPATMLTSRKYLLDIGGWREKFVVAEDGDLLNRLFEDQRSHFANVNQVLYYYNLNEGSVTNSMTTTLPYQMFKRYCAQKRRNNLPEPIDFEHYLKEAQKTRILKIKFGLEKYLWRIYLSRSII